MIMRGVNWLSKEPQEDLKGDAGDKDSKSQSGVKKEN